MIEVHLLVIHSVCGGVLWVHQGFEYQWDRGPLARRVFIEGWAMRCRVNIPEASPFMAGTHVPCVGR